MSRRIQLLATAMVMATCTATMSGSRIAAVQNPRITILGSVVDTNLKPLPNVSVALDRDRSPIARTTTDTAGAFRFADVAPGDYQVVAELSGFASLLRDIHVTAEADTMRLPLVLGATPAGSDGRGGSEPTANRGFRDLVNLLPNVATMSEAGRVGGGGQDNIMIDGITAMGSGGMPPAVPPIRPAIGAPATGVPATGDTYAHQAPNHFEATADHPLSTFGADVDTASYTNVRRFLSSGQLPPPDAVRVEEFVNYFHFDYPSPRGSVPIALTTETGPCPWAPSHRLVLIGARARAAAAHEPGARNLVLLIDVSGSMAPADRLPLIKNALALFVDTLRPDDRLSIVTYAGTSGIALPSTPVRDRNTIQRAIASLYASGSTNGGEGLITAYRVARQNFVPGGINRVILATDGDFNVGITNPEDLVALIAREKESGVFLSVFGVGRGNLRDATMEMLADRGNGHYAYLDSLQEARRVLVREADATLENVAKDVKFQVEFNPATVGAWRLVGYEDRRMSARDFNDDQKDGGEMGAGQAVTVLYEIVPAGTPVADTDRPEGRPAVDPLRYQSRPAEPVLPPPAASGEWLTVKVRYKTPEGDTSRVIVQPVRAGERGRYLPFATAVAEFGLLLRDDARDTARWAALERRVAALETSPVRAADAQDFQELVSTARGLAALR